MRLFIAEKPSVAKAIAEESGITQRGEGYFVCGNDTITWCYGHLLELAEPDCYLSAAIPLNSASGKKKWREEDLPILPQQWLVQPKEASKRQLALIGKLLKKASLIVHAGDADREGQLLVDEVLTYFGNNKPVLRFWAASHDSVTLKRCLNALTDNKTHEGLGLAAKARSQADWLIGMNLSRAYTLSAARAGHSALVTVGRVQTPTLKLVVDRDFTIEQFKPHPFYTLKAVFKPQGTAPFIAEWAAKEGQPGLDEERRLIDLTVANALIDKVTGQQARVIRYEQSPKSRQPPKAYTLSDLTLEACNRYGYTAADVLQSCQALYETHRLTSYPRTDCPYLPQSQWSDARAIFDALLSMNKALAPLMGKADLSLKSETWNDKKVTVHYGIIPTLHRGDLERLTAREKVLYNLIVKRYMAQFYPLQQFESTVITLQVAEECFTARGRRILVNGWCDLYQSEETNEKEAPEQTLPLLTTGETLLCVKASRLDSQTKPLSRFTEGTLLRAMENIHQLIPDAAHKKLLRDGDGIGTPATRAAIITELKNRGFIEARGKAIISSPLGRRVIAALPEKVKSPVLTALFERVLKTIEVKPEQFASFMQQQEAFVSEQVREAKLKITHLGEEGKKKGVLSTFECPSCQNKLLRRQSPKGYWWSCSGYPECRETWPDLKGKPNDSQKKKKPQS